MQTKIIYSTGTEVQSPEEKIVEEIKADFGRRGIEPYLSLEHVEFELFNNVGDIYPLNNNKEDYRSVIFVEHNGKPINVIKIYLKTRHGPFISSALTDWSYNPVTNAVNAYEENPDLFPETEEIGKGIIYADNKEFKIGCVRQEYIHDTEGKVLKNFLNAGFPEKEFSLVLEKWSNLVNKRKKPIQIEEAFDYNSYEEISEQHYDKFPSLQANYAIEALKETMRNDPILKKYKVPDVEETEQTKILGDFASRQVLPNNHYFGFDTEKYGLGEITRDLCGMLEDIALNYPKLTEDFVSFLLQELDEPDLIERMEKSKIGDNAERTLRAELEGIEEDRKHNKRLLDFNIKFYHNLKKKI